MQKSPFTAFLSLVHFDQETNVLRTQVQTLSQEIRSLKDTLKKLEHEQETTFHTVQAARKQVDAYELDMKALEEERRHKTKLLEAASSSKEHTALRKEIDVLRAQQNKVEQALMGAWNTLETSKKTAEVLTKTAQENYTHLTTSLREKEEKIQQITAEIAQREQEWSSHTSGLPEEILQKYIIMRTAVTDPVVPVYQDSCSVCFHSLTRQELVELRLKHLLQCKNCFRFLYLEPHE